MLEDVTLWDLDGTLSLHGEGTTNDRGHFDWDMVIHDEVNEAVKAIFVAFASQGWYRPVFMTGRMERARPDTLRWLYRHITRSNEIELYMREDDDFREDYVLKEELYREHIAPRYNVVIAFDDRQQVVDMYRDKCGLTVAQVAPGRF